MNDTLTTHLSQRVIRMLTTVVLSSDQSAVTTYLQPDQQLTIS